MDRNNLLMKLLNMIINGYKENCIKQSQYVIDRVGYDKQLIDMHYTDFKPNGLFQAYKDDDVTVNYVYGVEGLDTVKQVCLSIYDFIYEDNKIYIFMDKIDSMKTTDDAKMAVYDLESNLIAPLYSKHILFKNDNKTIFYRSIAIIMLRTVKNFIDLFSEQFGEDKEQFCNSLLNVVNFDSLDVSLFMNKDFQTWLKRIYY